VALLIAQEYEAASRTAKTMRQIQKTLEAMRELVTGESTPARATLRQVAEGWLVTKRPEISPASFDFYSSSVKKLLVAFAHKADLPVGEITRADLVRYRNAIAQGGVNAKTVNQHLKVAKMIFRLARKDGLISEDPSEFVDPVKGQTPASAKRPFRIEELRALLEVADPEWKSMIFFGLYTGQRLGDIARLTWANLDLPKTAVRLTTQKTGKVLIIPMADPLVRHVESLPISDSAETPLHPRAYGYWQHTGKIVGLSNQFATLLFQAGLRQTQPHGRGITKGTGRSVKHQTCPLSFHSLRHTATTLLHEAGVPAAVAQALIGHDRRGDPPALRRGRFRGSQEGRGFVSRSTLNDAIFLDLRAGQQGTECARLGSQFCS
jgi:integrase